MSHRTSKKLYNAALIVCSFVLFTFLSVTAFAWGYVYQEAHSGVVCVNPTALNAECYGEITDVHDVTAPTAVICGSMSQSQATPSTDHVHSYCVNNEVAPGCENNGYSVYVCSCGSTYKENYTHVLGHAYVKEVIEPGCETEGFTAYVCSACGEDYREDFVPALGHDYTSTVVEPSCTEDGYVCYVCSVCGDEYMAERTEALGHDYHYESSKPSTTTVAGYKLYRCANCGNAKQESLPLKASAMDADMCGDSLLGKVLPNAANSDFASAALEYYAGFRTLEDVMTAGPIPIPADADGRTVLNNFLDTYRYITCALPYTIYYRNNEETYLFWSSEEERQKMQEVYARVYEILDELGIDETVTQKEAIARINNWICEKKYYEYNRDLREYTTYHSIFGENAVCLNYAIEFQMLCLGAGIECHYYASDAMNHAWNKVYFSDGSYYWVDVCWNDAQYRLSTGTVVETSVENGVAPEAVKWMRERYLLITTAELLKDHTL